MSTDDIPKARVPADVDTPDKIAFGLSFRQLAIVATVAVAGWLAYHTFHGHLPAMVWLVAAIPVTAVTVLVTLGRRDGLPLDVWLRHGFTLTRTPRIQAPGQPRPTAVAALAGTPVVPAPLHPGVMAISPSGVLTAEGTDRVLIACGTTNVHLRTGDEQAALLDGFARWLNALTAPAQLVVAAQRHDLTPYAEAITATAARLPHSALRAAADDYATFLTDLDTSRDPLRRQVLAVVTGESAREATVRALTGIGVTAVALDGPAVTAALHTAVDPYAPVVPGGRAVPNTPITLRRPR